MCILITVCQKSSKSDSSPSWHFVTMFFSTPFTVDVSLFTLLFIPHLRRSSPHLPLHFFSTVSTSSPVTPWHLLSSPTLRSPQSFSIIVHSPHLYFQSHPEEGPERAKRLSTLPYSRPCLMFRKTSVGFSHSFAARLASVA